MLTLIASRCGREVQLSRGILGMGARKARAWPPELLPVARALYQLQRGSMLGPAPERVHPDHRLIGMNSLLSASAWTVQRMVMPRLLGLQDGGLHELPAVASGSNAATICKQLMATPSCPVAVLLDSGCSVLVLPLATPGGLAESGVSPYGLSEEDLHALRPRIIANASGGCPAPELRMVPSTAVAWAELESRLFPCGAAKEELFEQWCLAAGVQLLSGDRFVE